MVGHIGGRALKGTAIIPVLGYKMDLAPRFLVTGILMNEFGAARF